MCHERIRGMRIEHTRTKITKFTANNAMIYTSKAPTLVPVTIKII